MNKQEFMTRFFLSQKNFGDDDMGMIGDADIAWSLYVRSMMSKNVSDFVERHCGGFKWFAAEYLPATIQFEEKWRDELCGSWNGTLVSVSKNSEMELKGIVLTYTDPGDCPSDEEFVGQHADLMLVNLGQSLALLAVNNWQADIETYKSCSAILLNDSSLLLLMEDYEETKEIRA